MYWAWTSLATNDRPKLPLSPAYWSPTILASSEKTSETTKLIRLTPPSTVAASLKDRPPIWSVYVKDSDIQIERPYTPLEGLSDDGSLFFWIRKYPHGEMGRWLHSKKSGDCIEIRGPEQTWTWQEGAYENIVMVSASPPCVCPLD